MACIAVLFSTCSAVLFSLSLWAFGNASTLQLALGYIVVGQTTFWAAILRLAVLRPAPGHNGPSSPIRS
ncbi:MAG: hypothetical protein GW905_08885 [Rhodobacterales bacterium]|nr:hypothetical protein [Rhodobacterales bacterium]